MARQLKLNTPEKRARVGERIKVAATSAGLSLKELAEFAGTTPSMIYQYVRGIISIPPDTLERIAAVTRMHPDFFDPEKDARVAMAMPVDSTATAPSEGEKTSTSTIAREPGTRARIEAELQHLHELSEAQYYPKRNRTAYISTLEQMLSLSRTLGNRKQEAWVLWQLGNTKLEVNELEEAKKNILTAREIFAGAEMEDYRANATLDLAAALNEEGSFDAARDYLEEVQNVQDPTVRWRVLAALGSLRFRQYDNEGALRYFCQAAEQLEKVDADHRERAGMLSLMSNLADVVRATGHYEAAILLWSRCLQQATADRKADAFLESMLEIAQCCYVMGRIGEAKQRLELAVVLAGFLFEDEARLSISRALLADLLVKIGAPDEARDHAWVAVRVANRVRRARATILASMALAETSLAAGLWKDSLQYAQEAIDEGKRTKRTKEMAQARELRARAYLRGHEELLAAGNADQAKEALGQAFTEVNMSIDLATKAEAVPEHVAALLTRARCYLRQGDESMAEADAHMIHELTQEGAVGLQRLLGPDADQIPALLRSDEIDLPNLFAGRKLNLAALEWQANYLKGVLEGKQHNPQAFASMRDAAKTISQILSNLTQNEAVAFQKQYPEIAAVFHDLTRYAITETDKKESVALLESASWMKPETARIALPSG